MSKFSDIIHHLWGDPALPNQTAAQIVEEKLAAHGPEIRQLIQDGISFFGYVESLPGGSKSQYVVEAVINAATKEFGVTLSATEVNYLINEALILLGHK